MPNMTMPSSGAIPAFIAGEQLRREESEGGEQEDPQREGLADEGAGFFDGVHAGVLLF
jgi:hypothetical protein